MAVGGAIRSNGKSSAVRDHKRKRRLALRCAYKDTFFNKPAGREMGAVCKQEANIGAEAEQASERSTKSSAICHRCRRAVRIQ